MGKGIYKTQIYFAVAGRDIIVLPWRAEEFNS